LMKIRVIKKMGEARLFNLLYVWVASGQVSPVFQKPEKTQAGKMNRVILSHARFRTDFQFLSCPATGSGIPVPWLHQLFLLSHNEHKDENKLLEYVWFICRKLGRKVVKDGQILETSEEITAELKRLWKEFTENHRPLIDQLDLV